MNLLSILKKYKVSDLEEESKQVQKVSGLSTSEAWEVEKLKDEPRDFFNFHKEMSSQSIRLDENT